MGIRLFKIIFSFEAIYLKVPIIWGEKWENKKKSTLREIGLKTNPLDE